MEKMQRRGVEVKDLQRALTANKNRSPRKSSDTGRSSPVVKLVDYKNYIRKQGQASSASTARREDPYTSSASSARREAPCAVKVEKLPAKQEKRKSDGDNAEERKQKKKRDENVTSRPRPFVLHPIDLPSSDDDDDDQGLRPSARAALSLRSRLANGASTSARAPVSAPVPAPAQAPATAPARMGGDEQGMRFDVAEKMDASDNTSKRSNSQDDMVLALEDFLFDIGTPAVECCSACKAEMPATKMSQCNGGPHHNLCPKCLETLARDALFTSEVS